MKPACLAGEKNTCEKKQLSAESKTVFGRDHLGHFCPRLETRDKPRDKKDLA